MAGFLAAKRPAKPPFLIGICGAGSGSGKTAMAEELLSEAARRGVPEVKASASHDNFRETPGGSGHPAAGPWGAIKFTKTGIYTSVVTSPEVLREEGKDTARVLKAGAVRAVWVSSPGGADLEEALRMAMDHLEGCSVVLVEGNSAVELLKPDIVIFMSASFFKSGAEAALRGADIVFRPEGACIPAEIIRKDAVFCGSLELCADEVFKRMPGIDGKGTVTED